MTRAERIAVWGVGAAFRDDDGHVRTWYHGTTCADPFNVFTRCDEGSVGYHFGCADVASARVQDMGDLSDDDAPMIVPVLCRAVAPLRLDDLFCWGPMECLVALEAAQVITADEADDLAEGAFELATMYAYLEEAGYDSIVYANVTEARMGTGDAGSDSLIVWRPELLKSPFSQTFSPDDPRLLSQNVASTEDLRDWQWLRQEIASERAAIAQRRADLRASPSSSVPRLGSCAVG